MEEKIKVMTFGDNPKMSTYGCVWDNLLTRWAKIKPDWDFMHVGWQNTDRPHKTSEGYIMLPRSRDNWGFDVIENYLMKYQPNILITLADIGKQSGWIPGVNNAKKAGWRGKWIMYSPIDCHQWAVHWDEILMAPDVNVAMAESGEIFMKAHNVPNVKLIQHGVDTKKYFPLAEREKMRIRFGINDKFVCGFVGRNQTRKMIPYLMRGFAKFAKEKNDVVLLLHTDANPPGGEGRGNVIDALVWKFEKETDQSLFESKKIMLTESNMDVLTRQGIQPENLNDVYNLMDLFVYSTGGEGFGLPGIECQSSGIPIIMSDNTTGPELARKSGELIDMLLDKYGRPIGYIGTNGVENLIPDDEHIKVLLEKYYLDWKSGKKLLKEMSEKSRKLALTYEWDIIAKQWIDLFEENIC
jgi:glycosyltransferase involved in cell wall biosynthesis